MPEKRKVHGANIVPPPKRPPLIISYLEQMANLFSLVLFVCGLLSIVVFLIDTSYWVSLYTGLLFWAVAMFNAALEFWQVYSSAKTLEGFLSLVPSSALVMRDGQLIKISAPDIVIGDLLILRSGNKVPADVRILWGENVRVDNSSLTGESEPQERNSQVSDGESLEANNLLFGGTILISGDVVALVVRVGPHTVIGRLAQYAITAPKRVSMLETEMAVFFRRLVTIAFSVGIFALILAFSLGLDVQGSLDTAIGIFISFLPQGLPATMTILLTTAAKRMAQRNVLVKELRSVETLGAMTLLATDKTGTLTQNKMAVVGGWIYGQMYHSVEEMDKEIDSLSDFFNLLLTCTACKLDENEKGMEVEERNIYGDATEVGLLKFIGRHVNLDGFFAKRKKLAEIPFNSANKWHAMLIDSEIETPLLIVKGAPERILAKSAFYRKDGEILPMNDEFKERMLQVYEYFASKGLRILGLGSKRLTSLEYSKDVPFESDPANFSTDELVFLGLICLRDPPKEGVGWAISRLQGAGISVIMVTGDHPLTAEAIARQVGIINETTLFHRPPTASDMLTSPHIKAAILVGDHVEVMTASDWARVAQLKELVFARTAPRHKLEIVRQMQLAGHIVGVSGDGVNDSPALRKANLGISMNKTASDVSKDAAHMILLDDNFVSIVAGVFEGRLIFENIKKSMRYTLTHIPAEVTALLLFALLIIPPPLSPILLIFIDVFAELGPAVSFAREPPEYDFMLLPPRHTPSKPTNQFHRFSRILRKNFHLKGKLNRLIAKFFSFFTLPKTGEHLVDSDLIIWSFFEGGLIVAAGAWGAYVIALAVLNVPLDIIYRSYLVYWQPDSPPLTLTNETEASGSQQVLILGSVQAAFFLAILIAQWFNVFVQKRRYRYPLGPPWRTIFCNRSTYVGIFCAMVVAAFVCFIPVINTAVFKTNYPPAVALTPAFAAGIFLFVYEAVRRYLRVKGHFGGIPSKTVMKPLDDEVSGIEVPPSAPRLRQLSIMDKWTE